MIQEGAFLARKEHSGPMKGYVFKMGEHGLGYYKDRYGEWMRSGGGGGQLFRSREGRDTINLDEHLGVYQQPEGASFDDDISTDVSGSPSGKGGVVLRADFETRSSMWGA